MACRVAVGLVLAASVGATHLQSWCSSEVKVLAWGAACTPLPCDGTVVAGTACGWGLAVGDVVEGGSVVFNGMQGIAVCGNGDSALVLWDHWSGGEDGSSANTLCIGGCAGMYPTLTTTKQAWWVPCSDLHPYSTAPTAPNPPLDLNTSVGTTDLSVVWADKATYPPVLQYGDSLISGPSDVLTVRAGVLFGPLIVQLIYTGTTSVATGPQMSCTLTSQNATLGRSPTVLMDRGVATFDQLSFITSPYMEIPDKVIVEIMCTQTQGIGVNVSSPLVEGAVTVMFPNTATITPVITETIPYQGLPPNFYPTTKHPYSAPYDSKAVPVEDLPPQVDASNCQRDPSFCPFDCLLTTWSPWSACNESCGTNGRSTRYRTVVESSRYGGRPCSDFDQVEYAECNRYACDALCSHVIEGDGSTAGSPGDWTCGTYSAIKEPQLYLNGSNSPSVIAGCAALKPGVATNAVFYFSDSNVSVKVGDQVHVDMSGGSVGSSCNLIFNTPCVRIVVEVSKFGDGPWWECGVYDHTDTQGTQYAGGAHTTVSCTSPVASSNFFVRMRPLAVVSGVGSGSLTGGQSIPTGLGKSQNVRPDGTPYGGTFGSGQYATVFITRVTVKLPCVWDCELGEWGPWTLCTNVCGGGRQQRQRLILRSPINGGAACGPVTEERVCNTHHCNKDCEFTPWGPWSGCSISCGGGIRTRTRSITQHSLGLGALCPSKLYETEPCNLSSCGSDCVVSAWSQWGACSAPCDGGIQLRKRDILVLPTGVGAACPATQMSRECNIDPCSAPPTLQLAPDAGGVQPVAQDSPVGGIITPPIGVPDTVPLFQSNPAYNLPVYQLELHPAPGETREWEPANSVMTAFTVRLNAISVENLKTAPRDLVPSITAKSLDSSVSLSGTTTAPLTTQGTAAFVDLVVVVSNMVAGTTRPLDIGFSIAFTPQNGYEYNEIGTVRSLNLYESSAEESTALVAIYETAVESFDREQWRLDVSSWAGVPSSSIELLSVKEDTELGTYNPPTPPCNTNLRTIVVFRFTGASDKSVEYLQEALDPTTTLSTGTAPNCGVFTAFSAPLDHPRLRPYYNPVPVVTQPPTTTPNTESSSVGLEVIIIPILLFLWCVGVVAWLLYRNCQSKKEPPYEAPSTVSIDMTNSRATVPTEGMTSPEGGTNPIEEAFPSPQGA
eukprot:TRINITY_DN1084_c0_g1_i1.p1 TRINITY_DN1084_c0_g1~~TRINITY_DN1084_c0_g1_i1.p1  ORF type:complete len:1172 (+),score=130.87 TRINITY_DN1084_c0_g1_i1:38-3553(+)